MLVKMKKWTLYALKQDRDALLMALQKDGSVMIESERGEKGLEGAEEVSAQIGKDRSGPAFYGAERGQGRSLSQADGTVL